DRRQQVAPLAAIGLLDSATIGGHACGGRCSLTIEGSSCGREVMGATADAKLKLERAEVHRQTLNREFQRYWSNHTHEVVAEPHWHHGEVVLRAKVITPPDPAWSVIIGEWAHNLRCVLDYIAWDLAVQYQGGAPVYPLARGKAGRNW